MDDVKQKSAVVVGGKKPKNHQLAQWPKRRMLIWAIVILAVAGLALLIYQNHKNHAQRVAETICETTDSGSLLKQAAANLKPDKVTQLKAVVQKIQQLPSYQQDPNCLFVVVNYYINSVDIDNAQTYLTKFNKVYTGGSLSAYLSTTAQSVKTMRATVARLKKIQAQNNSNFRGIKQP